MFRKIIAWLKSLFSLNSLPTYPALPEKPLVSEKKLGATLKYPSTWEYVWEDGRVFRTESCVFPENNKWTMRDGTPASKEEAMRMNQAIEDWRAEDKRESARKIWDN